MAQFTNPKDLAAKQLQRATKHAKMLRDGHAKMVQEIYEEAIRITSGTKTRKQLRSMGYPYGRRSIVNSVTKIASGKQNQSRQRTVKNSRMRLNTLPINKQTGRLQKAMRMRKVQPKGKITQAFQFSILNSMAPYHKYILSKRGTSKMVTRPFYDHLAKVWKRKNFELLIKVRQAQKA